MTDALHLAVQSAFAVAQPLFDLLGRRPEFFAVRRSEPVDIWILVAALCLVVPIPLIFLEGLAALVHKRLRPLVHGFLCVVLLAAILLPALGRLDLGPWLEVGLALLFGLCGALALAHRQTARGLLTFMSPALLVFPAVFLLVPGIGKILHPTEVEMGTTTDATTPIVLLVFDELPLISLLSAPLEIDAVRYPNFAALAGQATWYRHTAAVSDFTVLAVPAILSGRLPEAPLLPIAPDYPQSLFTLVGESYAMNVSESVSQVCPARFRSGDGLSEGLGPRLRSLASDLEILYLHVLLPEAWTSHLPPVNQNWMLFASSDDWLGDWKRRQSGDRAAQVDRFLAAIQPTEGPVLHMMHVLLPHPPYDYLPSGQRYSRMGHVVGLEKDVMSSDPWAATQAQQRHLLQLGYVDKILGEIVQRLEDVGLWDRAVVVVTADHGASFEPGIHHRRFTDKNFATILSVPLLIKAPGQRQGGIDEHPASLIDVLPTIADLAGIDLPWPVDGVSLVQPAADRQERFHYALHRSKRPEPGAVAVSDVVTSEGEALAALEDRFGKGADGGREIYRLGTGRSWIGRVASDLPTGPQAPFEYSLRLPTGALDIVLDDPILPAHLSGRLIGGRLIGGRVKAPVHLAVAVNGVIAAVTTSWDFEPAEWSAVVDPKVFRSGVNSVELFEIDFDPNQSPMSLRPVSPVVPTPVVGLKERGLWGTERWDLGPIRWTDGDALFTVPVSASRPPRYLRLTIAATKPGGSPLRVTINGSRRLDTEVPPILLGESWSDIIELDGLDLGRVLTVELISDSFVPSEDSELSTDDRRLGVAIAGFELLRDKP